MSATAFQYRCPNCPQKLHADAKHVGFRARCPRCGQVHTVPSPEDPFMVGADDTTRKILSVPPAPPQTGGAPAAAAGDPFAQFQRSGTGLSRPVEKSSPSGPPAGSRPDARSNVYRRCPACKRVIPVDNQWAGLICSGCGAEIPGQ
jgi:predicted RNA-binding Zn-ribbon protein involved in translation (DUF1610 family)